MYMELKRHDTLNREVFYSGKWVFWGPEGRAILRWDFNGLRDNTLWINLYLL